MTRFGPRRVDPLERAWRHIELEPNSGCWIWIGSRNHHGYGDFGSEGLAHRYMWLALRGPVPSGLQLDHLCRMRACVNPSHLEAVTARENQRRGNGPPGLNARRAQCVHGHRFDLENTYWTKIGKRQCRRCKADRMAKYKITAGVDE